MFDNPLKIVSFGKPKPGAFLEMKATVYFFTFLCIVGACKYKEQHSNKKTVQKTPKESRKAKVMHKSDIRNATKSLMLSDAVARHFQLMDIAYQAIDMDLLSEANASLKETLIKRKKDLFVAKTIPELNIIRSEDKKLCLVSWNTREGGAGNWIDYANLAFFEEAATMQIDTVMLENTLAITYDTIYTLPHQKGMVYLVQSSVGAGPIAWGGLESFKIAGNQLVHPAIFPDTERDYFGEYETGYYPGAGFEFLPGEFNENREWPTFKIKNQAKTIWVPLHTADEEFADKYQVLQWNGKTYQRK